MQDLLDRITLAHENEVTANRLALTRRDIPTTYEAITPEWLTDVLCQECPEARVTARRLGDDDDGTSNRRRIYIEYNSAGNEAGLPESVFCKASQTLSSRLTLGVLGCTHAEHTFYTLVRPQLNIEAPVPLWANYDPETFASILILEDLGEGVEFCDHRSNITWDRAVSMVKLLASVHGRYYQSKDLGQAALPFTLWTDWFSRLEAVGMEEYTGKGFTAAEHVIPARLFARKDEIWDATIKSVARHGALPHTLLHSDTHMRNWYVAGDKVMALADWQSVCIGSWGRDYAYAVSCALTIENRRKWERGLLEIYLEAMRDAGAPAIQFDDAWRIYRQQLFSALAFWTVTLTPPPVMPDMQPVDVTLAFIERFAAAIDDLDALEAFDD
jgi:Phosphotransferase enzyme family